MIFFQVDLNQSEAYWSALSFGEEKVHVSLFPLDGVEREYCIGITVTFASVRDEASTGIRAKAEKWNTGLNQTARKTALRCAFLWQSVHSLHVEANLVSVLLIFTTQHTLGDAAVLVPEPESQWHGGEEFGGLAPLLPHQL